jgi:hypothetical protein
MPRRLGTSSIAILVAASLVLVPWRGASRAHADETPPATTAPATTDTKAGDAKPAESKPDSKPADAKPAGSSMDFDLFGDSSKNTPPGAKLPGSAAIAKDPAIIAKQVKTRRRMLELHQGFGFATLIVLAATCVIGQLNYQDKYGGGDFTNRYQYPHLGLSMGATALFAADGILALAAPTPYPKPIKADAALLHKVMMGIATAGMVTQIALGFATAAGGGQLQQRDMALGHLVVGYSTFASMLTGYLAYVF